MLSVLVDNSVLKTRADQPSDKEGVEMYSFLDKSERESKDSDIEPLYEGPKFLKRGKTVRYGLTALCLVVVVLGVLASVAVLCYKLATLKKQSQTNGTTNGDGQSLPLTTKTTCGYIQGTQEEGIYVFKGIPYAVPPTGKYRWKAPVPLEDKDGCWKDTYQATDFKTKCFQKDLYTDEIIGSEDCLYVNVWTPSVAASSALHVMVFIHGGGTETDTGHLFGSGLLTGSGQEGGMMPDAELAKAANMVFVSFNYRLGPFGFLAVNVTDPESRNTISGNYGFMDQTLLLKWVRDNIANFGGDPMKVTVFGLGGGATSIFALLSSQQSMGLFHKAWLASPSPSFDTKLEEAFKQNQDFIQSSGCGNADVRMLYSCLQSLSPDDVMAALPIDDWANTHFRDLPTSTERSTALAIVDGTFIKDSIHQTWHLKEGPFKNVSLLIGSAAQEVDDWLHSGDLSEWTWEAYDEHIEERFSNHDALYEGDLSDRVLELYPHEHTPEYQLTSMISDIRQVCGVNFMAHLMSAKWIAPVYRYIANFTIVSPDLQSDLDSDPIPQDQDTAYEDDLDGYPVTSQPGFRYAYHGIEVRHFFAEHEEDTFREPDFVTETRRAVFEFVRGGNITNWKPFPAATGILSSHMTQLTSSQYHSDKCLFWKQLMFFPQHAWMNR